ncbi:MAG: hypothetical protein EKK60_13840 [Gordonia sp. (in: high G+C Gram-positive bacteria)]|nr:MAG: hypothetical protein EKK60_13840 [Gordonia sp. (in: high G+C Gram-positive bacteria)]
MPTRDTLIMGADSTTETLAEQQRKAELEQAEAEAVPWPRRRPAAAPWNAAELERVLVACPQTP